MFIKNKKQFEIGDYVCLTQDIQVMKGTFTQGHKMKITRFGERGVDLMDDDGECLTEVNPGFFGGEYPFV